MAQSHNIIPRGSLGFPGGSDGKESACNAGDMGLIPGLGRSPGRGHGNPLQYSCLENPHRQKSLAQRVEYNWATKHSTQHRGSLQLIIGRNRVTKPLPSLTKFWKAIPFSSVQSLSLVWLFVTPWTTARQASLSITNSRSLLKLMSVMSSNHLILYCPLTLPPSNFLSIRVFSNESVLCIRWPKHWSFSFSISPSNEYSGLISFRIDWFDSPWEIKGFSRVFSNTTVQKYQFFGAQLSLWSNSHIHTWLLEKT